VIGFFFRKFYSEEDSLFPKIKVNELKDLPLKDSSEGIQNTISNIVDYLLLVNKEKKPFNEYVPNQHIARQFEEVIDACVYELYFPDEVKAKDAEVLQWVRTQFNTIENSNKPEQIEIVNRGYQLLRDSNNEIRSRLTRQKLVEEIAIINGSIQ